MHEAAVRDITPGEFAGFQRLIGEASGITLSTGKRQLLVGRIARTVRERGLTSYGAYLEAVRADRTGQELVRLIDMVSTNETRFFRETPHYQYIADVLCPAWKEDAAAAASRRTIRVWSAACSTGQEPYSVAMTLLVLLPAGTGWSVEVVASDISTRVLDVGAQGEYDVARAGEIPPPLLRRFMLRGVGPRAGRMSVTPELRRTVTFTRINLSESRYQVAGTFDLIFCSNALIYFSPEGRAAVVERLAQRLSPRGRLFVGHAESLHDHRALLRSVAPTVYALAEQPGS
jgi:chemotaxis protein methyltransferase CheR